jgi:hypothetical protein
MIPEPKRFCEATKTASPLSGIYGWPIVELDPNERTRLMGFSKPRSAKTDVDSAIRRAVELARAGGVGDLLVKPVGGHGESRGWQVWERRAVRGRRWEPGGGDTRAVRGPCGTGRVFIL